MKKIFPADQAGDEITKIEEKKNGLIDYLCFFTTFTILRTMVSHQNSQSLLLTFVFLNLFFSQAEAQAATCADVDIIRNRPVDTVGIYGQESTFHCSSNRPDVIYQDFTVNDVTLANSTEQGITISKDNTTLTLVAKPEYNGIIIQCNIVISIPLCIESAGALFTVTNASVDLNKTLTVPEAMISPAIYPTGTSDNYVVPATLATSPTDLIEHSGTYFLPTALTTFPTDGTISTTNNLFTSNILVIETLGKSNIPEGTLKTKHFSRWIEVGVGVGGFTIIAILVTWIVGIVYVLYFKIYRKNRNSYSVESALECVSDAKAKINGASEQLTGKTPNHRPGRDHKGELPRNCSTVSLSKLIWKPYANQGATCIVSQDQVIKPIKEDPSSKNTGITTTTDKSSSAFVVSYGHKPDQLQLDSTCMSPDNKTQTTNRNNVSTVEHDEVPYEMIVKGTTVTDNNEPQGCDSGVHSMPQVESSESEL